MNNTNESVRLEVTIWPECCYIDFHYGAHYISAYDRLRSISMRMILPPLKERRVIQKYLTAFFRDHRTPDFNRAISGLCRFYHLKRPRIEWFEYIDWGRTVGKTYEDGKIHLVHPENWKNGRKYNSERQWVNAVYHEMGHYVFWADAERKADSFALRMVKGLSNGNHRHNGNGRR